MAVDVSAVHCIVPEPFVQYSAVSDVSVASALREHQHGNYQEAEALYRSVLLREPDDFNALHLLGMLLHQLGRQEESLGLLRQSVAIAPEVAHFHSNIASVLGKLKRPEEALHHLREARRLKPALPEAHNNFGVTLEALERYEEAATAYREALRLRPEYAECHNNLGNTLRKQGFIEEAIAAHERAIALKPNFGEAHGCLGSAYSELGRVEESIAAHRRCVALRPGSAQAHSDLLFTLMYSPDLSPREVFEEHVGWGERHARPFYPAEPRYENDRDPDRRLRIGYVSPDFRSHPVSRFLEPILRHHDRERFETYCYSDVARPDAVTIRLRQHASAWRETAALDDGQLAELIRHDRIDILVDLSGHMGGNRLLVFARKPAPVQITYLGYPNTTGVRTIDYRISDSRHDPEGENDDLHVEKLLRIGECCWCYQPDEDSPPVNELPCLTSGRFTFCCLNKLVKITPPMIRLWSRILDAVPDSRLMVLVRRPERAVYELFERNGIAEDRLVLCPRVPRQQYLRLYHQVDLALDTFPYNGHTTTCDALWMGVPTVTLAGRTHVSRAGLSVLSAVGLGDFVCYSCEEYLERAIAPAHAHTELAVLRVGLRSRVRRTPLMQSQPVVQQFERAIQQVCKQATRRIS
jgi:predicted O-linked N-acetylglucosamine transferase (SPINDLY family)